MSRPILEVQSISKRYRLGSINARSLKEEVSRLWGRMRGRTMAAPRGDFWALRDVSFSVGKGEVIGILGRNGAGKSTLLKILSRITRQTSGEVRLRGRIASLLEVGTGFHPDLSGRDNIFLNGAILGMSRAEIRRKLDEIIAFAEVEQFIDTPVKRYSSGMYVRLAFAVAAHLEPEILIVDEVLAVGDAQFQKKCLGKMNEVSHQHGRTVLFVSHNMAVMRSLCSRALVLDKGVLVQEGPVDAAIRSYLDAQSGAPAEASWKPGEATSGGCSLHRAYVVNHAGQPALTIQHNERFSLCIEYECTLPLPGLRVGFLIQNNEGIEICGSNDFHVIDVQGRQAGRFVSRCTFPADLLNEGSYHVRFKAETPHSTVLIETPYCLNFAVEDLERHSEVRHLLPGVLRPRLAWSVCPAEEATPTGV
jgi:lipopolysaccharide transport system ATP-binding protein